MSDRNESYSAIGWLSTALSAMVMILIIGMIAIEPDDLARLARLFSDSSEITLPDS